MKLIHILMKACLLHFLLFSFVFHTYAASSKQKYRKTTNSFEIALPILPSSLDPIDAWHYVHSDLLRPYLRTLVKLDKENRITADLARRWKISSDGRRYSFHLDRHARFHDGALITSKDIAFSLSRHLWQGSMTQISSYLGRIVVGAENLKDGQIPSGIITPNQHTIILSLKRPYPYLLELLAVPGYGVTKKSSGSSSQVVGSGSFSLDSVQLPNRLQMVPFVPNDSHISRLSFRRVESANQLLSQLRNDSIDFALGFADPGLQPGTLPNNYQLLRLGGLGILHLYTNTDNPALSNESFRRDIAALIKTRVSQIEKPGFFIDHQKHFLPHGVLLRRYYERDFRRMSPISFKKLWKNKVKHKKLRIVLRKEYLNIPVGKAISEVLTNVGMIPIIEFKNIEEVIPLLKSKDYDLIMVGYFGVIPDPDGFLDLFRAKNPIQFGNFPTTKLLKGADEISFISDRIRRLEKYTDLMIEFEEKSFIVPLFHLYTPVIYHKHIKVPEKRYQFDFPLYRLQWAKDNEI